ncbi:hypothetical protein [Fuerstiella marisgermanici]|nr:hypothetical protein [Fuerstiella marisgermanici]
MTVETDSRRSSADYTRAEQIGRVLWNALQPLFAYSPRLMYAWRNFLLRLFGAEIGSKVQIYPSVRIFTPWTLAVGAGVTIGDNARIYNVGRIVINDDVTISQNAHLCAGTHDYQRSDMRLVRTPIVVQSNSWICCDAFVGPGVTIGKNAIVGARSVVFKDVGEGLIVGGNPAKFIRYRAEKNCHNHLKSA